MRTKPTTTRRAKGYLTLSQLLQKRVLEGSSLEYKDTFFTNEEGEFCKTETKVPFTGVIKIRSRKGSISELQSYSTGLMNGDFFQWHDNGRLKSKSQYKDGMRHGYFYIWTNSGIVYSRKFYDNDLEDFQDLRMTEPLSPEKVLLPSNWRNGKA